jgi:hypothetical protein
MNPPPPKHDSEPRRRRYLVHLLCVLDSESHRHRYIARIRPWAAHNSQHIETRERAFADECELIATINPLLPPASDVRDVFEHIESPNGFFYLLHLCTEEASRLGWQT